MADSLRDKLAKNTAATPQARAAQTFTTPPTPPAGESTERERNSSRTTVYFSPDLRRRLKIAAANADRTMNDIVIEATEKWLSEESDTKPL